MNSNKIDDLQKAMQIMKDAESITDAELRRRMQEAVLSAVEQRIEPPVNTRSTSEQQSEPRQISKERTNRQPPPPPRPLGFLVPGSAPEKVLHAVKTLASRQNPLTSNDLENMVDGVRNELINKTLSGLYARKLIRRVKATDKDAAGAERIMYKYYWEE